MTKLASFLLLVVIMTSSCRVFKKSKVGELPMDKNVYNNMVSRNVDFKYLSAKAKMKATIGESSNSFTTNFRFEKDQVIWGSVSALTIELARFIITPDSIKLMDRFNQQYLSKPYSYLYEYTQAEINFSQLQDLLLGNFTESLVMGSSSLKSDLGLFILGKKEDLEYSILCDTKEFNVLGYAFLQSSKNLSLKVDYANYQSIENARIPQDVWIRSKSPEGEAEITINFVKLEKEETLSFPYKVPEKYEQIP